jgi:hypothetical protein
MRKIKTRNWIACGVLAFAFAKLSAAPREFTSNDGKKLLAVIVSATEDHVVLKRASDAKEFTLPLNRLSEEDQKVIGEWLLIKKANTRPAKKVTIAFEGGKTETVDVPEGPYLTEEGTLTLCLGDTIHLEFDEAGKPFLVSEVKNAKRTIKFALSQQQGITMLSRTTQMQETVAMDCMHRGWGSEKFARTNLRPTEKALGAFDSWPGTVWTVQLSAFEVTNRPATEVYEKRVAK